MSDNWLLGTIGYMAYYILKPILILHAILSTSWKAARMVQGLAAENNAYFNAQASLVLPVFQPHHDHRTLSVINDRPLSSLSHHTLERHLSVASHQSRDRPFSVLSHQTHNRPVSITHERPLSVASQTSDRPLSARYPSGYSLADVMLQQQLVETESEKGWSRLPSYSLYDQHTAMLPTPPPSPGVFGGFYKEISHGETQQEKNDVRIVVYPVEKREGLSPMETMKCVPVAM